MSRRSAVIDTNVVVSGLIGSDPLTPPAQIVDAMLDAAIPFVVSTALMAEYRQVLLRRPIAALHGLNPEQVDVLLLRFARDGMVVEPPRSRRSAPDAGDSHLWDLLAARPEAVLVTGDALLLRRGTRGRVLSPRAFVEGWAPPGSRTE